MEKSSQDSTFIELLYANWNWEHLQASSPECFRLDILKSC